MAELTAKIDITTKITEENDRFIFETIYPFCCEKAKMVLKKSDLEEALLIWKAYKDGRKSWAESGRKRYRHGYRFRGQFRHVPGLGEETSWLLPED